MNISINMRVAAVAAVAGLAIAGLKAFGQAAPAAPAAAETFGTPVFTEDFESGELKKDVWELRIGTGGGGGGARGARGGAPAAGAPAASQPTPAAAPATPAPPAPAAPAAAAGTTPTITVVKDHAAHGKNSVLVHYPANSRAYSFITTSHLPDSLKNHVFGRAYVQFPKTPPAGHILFITCGSAGFPISNFMEIGNRQNAAQLSYQQNGTGVPRGETMIAGPAYPVGKWFCLEWEFNDNPDTITIWIDGQKVTDKPVGFQGNGTNLIKGFTDFSFGFRSWGNVTTPFEVYYDDIAFGTQRIGPIK